MLFGGHWRDGSVGKSCPMYIDPSTYEKGWAWPHTVRGRDRGISRACWLPPWLQGQQETLSQSNNAESDRAGLPSLASASTHPCSYTIHTSTQICSHTINNLPSLLISYSCSSLCLNCSRHSFILVFILECCRWKLYYTQHNWPPGHFCPVVFHFRQKEVFTLTVTPSPPRGYDHDVKTVFTGHIEFLN